MSVPPQDAGGEDQSAAALLSAGGSGESELEAKVRLGEVTPFGTALTEVTTAAEPARSVDLAAFVRERGFATREKVCKIRYLSSRCAQKLFRS